MEGEFRLPVHGEPKTNTAQLRWGEFYLQKGGLYGIGLVCFDKKLLELQSDSVLCYSTFCFAASFISEPQKMSACVTARVFPVRVKSTLFPFHISVFKCVPGTKVTAFRC